MPRIYNLKVLTYSESPKVLLDIILSALLPERKYESSCANVCYVDYLTFVYNSEQINMLIILMSTQSEQILLINLV